MQLCVSSLHSILDHHLFMPIPFDSPPDPNGTMFGTWRLDSCGIKAHNPTFLRANRTDQKACDRCRVKKLKCTGEVSGCERCTSLRLQCTYSAPKPSGRRRRLSDKSESVTKRKRQKLSPSCPSPEVLDLDTYNDDSLEERLPDTNKQELPNVDSPLPRPDDDQLYDGADTFERLLGKTDDDILSLFTDLDSTSPETSFEPWTPFSVPSPAIAEPNRTAENDNEKEICQCLHRVVLVLEELEVMLDNYQDPEASKGGMQLVCTRNTGAWALDSALSLHKKAVLLGESMQRCGRCFSRAENKVLLSLLARRLLALCIHMVSVFIAEPSQLYGNPLSILTARVMAGEYQVDTGQEAAAVFRELVAFQLAQLHKFLSSLLAGLNKSHGVELHTVRNRVCGLLWRLRQDSLVSVFESTALSQVS